MEIRAPCGNITMPHRSISLQNIFASSIWVFKSAAQLVWFSWSITTAVMFGLPGLTGIVLRNSAITEAPLHCFCTFLLQIFSTPLTRPMMLENQRSLTVDAAWLSAVCLCDEMRYCKSLWRKKKGEEILHVRYVTFSCQIRRLLFIQAGGQDVMSSPHYVVAVHCWAFWMH